MKTLEIPVKFQKGDTIYTTKQVKLEKECHICEGKGTITYNGKDMRCPECMGTKKFISDKQKHVVCENLYEIRTIKITINSDNNISVKYKGACGNTLLNRAEENLFTTKEEAQARCDELNKEKIYITVKDIVIRDDFKLTQPSLDKIQEKFEYYKQYRKFDKHIVIDKNYTLQDGYINYLLCGLFNIDVVRVVIE